MNQNIFNEVYKDISTQRTEASMSGDRSKSYNIRKKQTQLLAWLKGSERVSNIEIDNKTVNNIELNLSQIKVEKQQLDINVVRFCPAKCEFCSVPASKYIKQVSTENFIDQTKELLVKLKKTNVNRVIITGGEPLHDIDRLSKLINIVSSSKIDWEVFSIITNGQFLPKFKDNKPFPQILEEAGLKQIAWSIHSFDIEINNNIFGIPIDIQAGFEALRSTNLELRLNLTLNNQGVYNMDTLKQYLDNAGKYNVKSVYCRDLFNFTDPQIGYESHSGLSRNQAKYYTNNHINPQRLIEELVNNQRFQAINSREFETREKTEYEFLDLKTGIKVYISLLSIGNESPIIDQNGKIQLPYLVMQPDGKLYTDYINGKEINF